MDRRAKWKLIQSPRISMRILPEMGAEFKVNPDELGMTRVFVEVTWVILGSYYPLDVSFLSMGEWGAAEKWVDGTASLRTAGACVASMGRLKNTE